MELLRIKDICRAKKIKMEELANKLEITRATLTRNISGNPTIETLGKIANALDVPIQELFAAPNEDFYGVVIYKGVPHQIDNLESLKQLVSLIEGEKPVSDSPK